MDKIGPTFAADLIAAGVADGVTWDVAAGDLTFTLLAGETDASLASRESATRAVLAAHDPSKPAVPASVTRLQGRLQLSAAGLLPAVEAAIAAAGGTLAIWYEDAQTWARQDPHILGMAAALSPPLTAAQVDALFIAAGAIG